MRFAVLAVVVLCGCMTMTKTESLVVVPRDGETRIAVTSTAVVRCRDYVLFSQCTLSLEMARHR